MKTILVYLFAIILGIVAVQRCTENVIMQRNGQLRRMDMIDELIPD